MKHTNNNLIIMFKNNFKNHKCYDKLAWEMKTGSKCLSKQTMEHNAGAQLLTVVAEECFSDGVLSDCKPKENE